MNPICGAKSRGTGKPCQLYPCKNGRGHLHGGKSTGAKTLKGIQRIKEANTKHGYYSKERLSFREMVKELSLDHIFDCQVFRREYNFYDRSINLQSIPCFFSVS